MESRCLSATLTAVWLLGSACAGDGTGLGSNGGADEITLSDVQPIFTAECALSGCHIGPSPALGQDLSTGRTFANVVNIASTQLPSMNRVTPGQPDNSYLVHKIQGTHVTLVPGSGVRMPKGRSQLSQPQIDLIRSWISEGARPN